MPSLPPAYFDALYRDDPDPWRFATSGYEAGKYAATMDALPRGRYGSALEVGCSIGVLTAELARRCDAVLAIDVAAAALDAARARNIDQPNVRFEEGSFPGSMPSQMPAGGFDLILLSELLYYLCPETLVEAARLAAAVARPGADILLVHWLGPTPDYPLSGNEAAGQFIAALGSDVELLLHRSMPDYRIDLLRRSASR